MNRIQIDQLLSEVEISFSTALSNETTKNLLRSFVSKTHPSYYLLRFSRLEIITDILTQPARIKGIVTPIGKAEDMILYTLFGVKDHSVYNSYYKNISTICERHFYQDRFKYEDNSRSLEFCNKFKMLIELMPDILTSDKVSALGVLKAVFEVASRMFAEKFHAKWKDHINCEDENLLINAIAPHIGNISEDDKYLEIGEITSYYLYKQWFVHNNFFIGYDEIKDAIKNSIERKRDDSFKAYLLETEATEDTDALTINDVDMMDGIQFEKFIGKLFAGQGYLVSYTPQTGDQGVDLIAEKNGVRVGIQAKRYTGRISNSAIQEIVAGKIHHLCDNAMVVTNSYFTKSAIDLAVSNNVILWDRTLLKDKLSEKQL
jgi:HJR/Mrr/RecB family endonuclease